MRAKMGLADDDRGGAAVEFALVGPLFILLLIGMVVYGGWFWLAHGVQALASEGARAAVAGLDAAEREALARGLIAEQAPGGLGLDPAELSVAVTSDPQAIRVQVRYDVSGHPLMALSGLAPAPPSVIERTAVVRVGGY